MYRSIFGNDLRNIEHGDIFRVKISIRNYTVVICFLNFAENMVKLYIHIEPVLN